MKMPFVPAIIFAVILLISLSGHGIGQTKEGPRFKAIAFDYFVIFDPNSIIPETDKAFPCKGAEFARMWRSKQFDYCFLQSITHQHTDFFRVTEDALIYTAKALNLPLPDETRKRLMNAYLTLKPWPDAVSALHRLKASGIRIITISNFTRNMLKANATAAGIADLFDDLVSTEENNTYKPEPQAYELGIKKTGLKKEEIIFAAFGGWDAYGAKSFGYTTYWVNRFNLPAEELGIKADQTSTDMEGLLKFVLGNQ